MEEMKRRDKNAPSQDKKYSVLMKRNKKKKNLSVKKKSKKLKNLRLSSPNHCSNNQNL